MTDFYLDQTTPPSTQLYVGNIPWSTTEAELSDLFSASGFEVAAVNIPMGRGDRPRGYAILTLASADAAAGAIQTMEGA